MAWAFTLNSSHNSNLLGWNKGEIQLDINESNCPASVDVPAIIADAAAVWNNVPTSTLKVSVGNATTSTSMASPVTVYCETNFGGVAHPDYVPGAAAVNGSTGRITQGILYLNASGGQANIANFSATELKVILAHEIGHIVGLGHSDSPVALMYYDASAKTELKLSQDDIDGVAYLYPSDEFNDKKWAGCGLIKDMKPPTTGSMGTFLFLTLLPLLTYLSLRRRLKAQKWNELGLTPRFE